MTGLTPNNTILYNQYADKYPADVQRGVYEQSQTNDMYAVNSILIVFYYGFLLYYTYYAYDTFRYSTMYYKKLMMLILLFAYPFIIYPIQYVIYNLGKYIINLVYLNVYETKDW